MTPSDREKIIPDGMVVSYVHPKDNEIQMDCLDQFGKGCILVPAPTLGTIWVYHPIDRDDVDGEWGIVQVTITYLCVPMYRGFKKGVRQMVTSGCGTNGVYLIIPASKSLSYLILFDENNYTGKLIRSGVPTVSRLFTDQGGGVWVHVPTKGSTKSSTILQPGLWHFTAACKCSRMVSDLDDEKCLMSSDRARTGVLLLLAGDGTKQQPVAAAACQSLLSHVHVSGERRNQVVDVNFSHVQAIYDNGSDGALIHYKSGEVGWKLANVCFGGDGNVCDVYTCPKNAKLSQLEN